MNDHGSQAAGWHAYTAFRLADQDAARSEYLRREMEREPPLGDLCKRGHNDWWTNARGVKRCRTCHRLAMAASRERRGV